MGLTEFVTLITGIKAQLRQCRCLRIVNLAKSKARVPCGIPGFESSTNDLLIDQEPATVMLPIKIDPVCLVPRIKTSLPIAAISLNISRKFPAMVISSTGY